MAIDVTELKAFYAGPLGSVVRRLLAHEIRAVWPDERGRRLAGLGFATPFLQLFREEAERVLAFMPATQGVIPWPESGPQLAALVDPIELPLPDACLDRLLLIHALDVDEGPRALLREAWRVLAPQGRLLVVAPNRRGLWARAESTPFGQGQPFSRAQLRRLLEETFFDPVTTTEALHLPPHVERIGLRSAFAWERVGRTLWPAFAGVILVEASKRLYAPVSPARHRRFVPALEPALVPSGAQ
jgi:SAM-dependent methyltransferase